MHRVGKNTWAWQLRLWKRQRSQVMKMVQAVECIVWPTRILNAFGIVSVV